jgi:hypothetical protein
MSNGIASGVPPADGGAGGVAGAGAGVCANAAELMTAIAQAASVIETIERIGFSRLKSASLKGLDCAATLYATQCRNQNAGPAPFLP